MLHENNTPVVTELFRNDPDRAERFSVVQGDWSFDFSRIPLTDDGLAALRAAIDTAAFSLAVERLFGGAEVNPTEGQAALHMALRAQQASALPDQVDPGELAAQRDRFLDLAGDLHSGKRGLTDLLHIGIGGSDLGPRLVADALDGDDGEVRVHWLSTLDGRRFDRLCRRLDPATTGMVIASKSFTTEETLAQAKAARDWLGKDWAGRAWAATANRERATDFGIRGDHVLAFPHWTGGRFSLWSSVGVSAAACIGPRRFRELLAGAAQADRDFRDGPHAQSLAVLAGLVMHHLRRELGFNTLGIVSYEPRLALLADHLQQLVMESLGKRVDLDNRPIDGPTAPLIFGGRGTDLQHSIFQALHQGTDTHPLILVGTRNPDHARADWHRTQLAHLLAQATALANGRSDAAAFQNMPGNRPVAALIAEQLTAENLGWLLASLEHTVYTLSVLWRVNAFDQWGVEEGKRLAGEIRKSLDG